MNTLYWHDYETFGIDPSRDCPSQFAGVRTDENLNIIGEPLSIYCQPPIDRLPSPMACLVTGITPQKAREQGIPESVFIEQVYRELSQPGTCGVGYNSIRFDDEVTRYTLYRNFYDPYEREWKHGNSRWDIIDMVRLARALRPEGIEWPNYEDGSPCFKLEQLTQANGISHESAHDALSDVMATIAMARLVRDKQPKLYQYIYEHRLKQKVAALIDLKQQTPFLHVSGKLPRDNGYTALMVPLAKHPSNSNAIICFNLQGDARALLDLSPEQIRERLFTRADDLPEGVERLPLKNVQINRCPVVATAKLLDEAAAERLGIDLQRCERNRQLLQGCDLSTKLAAVFSGQEFDRTDDVDRRLYDGFLGDSDRLLLSEVRRASSVELAADRFHFGDERYQQLLFLYRARNYPESLNEEELHLWEEWRFNRLTSPSSGYLCLETYHSEINQLLAKADVSERDRALLHALQEWGDQIL
ncbi:exodeoxyribonuclease I [Porticoccus sp.]